MSEKANFYVSAAKYSWAAPLGAVLLNFMFLLIGAQQAARGEADGGTKLVISGICALLIVSGLALGIVALFGISKHGAKAILMPAVIGILINLMLIVTAAVTIMNIRAARARNAAAAVSTSELAPSIHPRL